MKQCFTIQVEVDEEKDDWSYDFESHTGMIRKRDMAYYMAEIMGLLMLDWDEVEE